jgi:uncharacterized RDD family membrane protein YckC
LKQRKLSVTPLEVSQELAGQRLASPLRRLVAFGMDAMILLVPTVIVTVLLATLALRIDDPSGFNALVSLFTGDKAHESSADLMSQLAPMLVRTEAKGLPPEAIIAVEQDDLQLAGEILSRYELDVSLILYSADPPLMVNHIRLDISRLFPQIIRGTAIFLSAIVYFTLLTAGKKKGTLGKRIMGIRVVRLNNRPLSHWESFERVGGYLASLGTLGIGLLDFWRDPNRRLAHDRIANTIVLRTR